jgi:hypothetical protein
MEALLEEAQRTYPDQPSGDDDRWWVPAHLGGTAPTPEQAGLLDAQHAAGNRAPAARAHPLKRLTGLVTRLRR